MYCNIEEAITFSAQLNIWDILDSTVQCMALTHEYGDFDASVGVALFVDMVM